MPDTLSREELAAIRERHRYVEGHNADGDERTGCICGELWQCDAADLLARIDALAGLRDQHRDDPDMPGPVYSGYLRALDDADAILRGER